MQQHTKNAHKTLRYALKYIERHFNAFWNVCIVSFRNFFYLKFFVEKMLILMDFYVSSISQQQKAAVELRVPRFVDMIEGFHWQGCIFSGLGETVGV